MKKTWLILLFAFALCACKHTQQETHVSDIFLNAQYEDTHAISDEYHCYALCEASFQEVLLSQNCTDEELQAYDFQKAYKAVYGNHVMFY